MIIPTYIRNTVDFHQCISISISHLSMFLEQIFELEGSRSRHITKRSSGVVRVKNPRTVSEVAFLTKKMLQIFGTIIIRNSFKMLFHSSKL